MVSAGPEATLETTRDAIRDSVRVLEAASRGVRQLGIQLDGDILHVGLLGKIIRFLVDRVEGNALRLAEPAEQSKHERQILLREKINLKIHCARLSARRVMRFRDLSTKKRSARCVC